MDLPRSFSSVDLVLYSRVLSCYYLNYVTRVNESDDGPPTFSICVGLVLYTRVIGCLRYVTRVDKSEQ